ncbi:hypothetical protein AB8898_05645 [Yersinia enterocolitica]|nr:hypothetical protein [Yersinia enterocolitica]
MKIQHGFRSSFREGVGETTDHQHDVVAHQLVEEIPAVPAGGNPCNQKSD